MVIKPILERLFEGFGFTDENAIASVCICRDEISQTIRSHIKSMWGEAFNFSSLAGLFTAGKTGIKAFISHAPKVNGRKDMFFMLFLTLQLMKMKIWEFVKERDLKNPMPAEPYAIF